MITAIAKPPARPRFERKETPPVPALPEETTNELVKLFKLLSDGTRLQIIHFLTEAFELNVGNLCELLEQSQPAVSHHLALLREATIVDMRREGKHNFYRLRRSSLARYQLLVNSLWDGIAAGPAATLPSSPTSSPPQTLPDSPAADSRQTPPTATPPSQSPAATEPTGGPGQLDSGDSKSGELDSGKISSGEISSGEIGSGELGTDVEARQSPNAQGQPSDTSDHSPQGEANDHSPPSNDKTTENPGGETSDPVA